MGWPIPESNTFVYALVCPYTDEIKYIGKTVNGLIRLYGHWRDFRKSSLSGKLTRKQNWVKKLKKEKVKFKVIYLEYCENEEQLNDRERYWIAKFKADGVDLLNHTEGGEKAVTKVFTEEEKLQISIRTKEAMSRPDVRERFLKGTRNRKMPSKYKSWSKENKFKQSQTAYAKSKKKRVVSSEGMCFNSINDAAKFYNLKAPAVYARAKSSFSKNKLGFYFFNPDIDPIIQHEEFLKTYRIPKIKKSNGPLKVINSQGVIFNSIAEAARVYNINSKTLQLGLSKKHVYLDLKLYTENGEK